MLPAAKVYALLYYDGIRRAHALLGKKILHLGQPYRLRRVYDSSASTNGTINYDDIKLESEHVEQRKVVLLTLSQAQDAVRGTMLTRKRSDPAQEGSPDSKTEAEMMRKLEPQVKAHEQERIVDLILSMLALVPAIPAVSADVKRGAEQKPGRQRVRTRRQRAAKHVLVVEAPLGPLASGNGLHGRIKISNPLPDAVTAFSSSLRRRFHIDGELEKEKEKEERAKEEGKVESDQAAGLKTQINDSLRYILMSQAMKQPMDEALTVDLAELTLRPDVLPSKDLAAKSLWDDWRTDNAGLVDAAASIKEKRTNRIVFSLGLEDDAASPTKRRICEEHGETHIRCECYLPASKTASLAGSSEDAVKVANPFAASVIRPKPALLRTFGDPETAAACQQRFESAEEHIRRKTPRQNI